jgi:hypothetical protein
LQQNFLPTVCVVIVVPAVCIDDGKGEMEDFCGNSLQSAARNKTGPVSLPVFQNSGQQHKRILLTKRLFGFYGISSGSISLILSA